MKPLTLEQVFALIPKSLSEAEHIRLAEAITSYGTQKYMEGANVAKEIYTQAFRTSEPAPSYSVLAVAESKDNLIVVTPNKAA